MDLIHADLCGTLRYVSLGMDVHIMLLSSPDVFHAHPIEALSSELAEVPLERSIGVWTGHLWPTCLHYYVPSASAWPSIGIYQHLCFSIVGADRHTRHCRITPEYK